MTQGGESYWVASTPETAYPELSSDVEVDVAVVGAGITGVTAAVLLKRAGKTVALLDAKRIVQGATGYTTAKVTSGHGAVYAKLVDSFGEEGARLYAESNQAAIERIHELGPAAGIECDFERKDNYVFAQSPEERRQLEQEAEVMRRVGLPASFVAETPLPLDVAGAVRLENQAQFHPRKYLLALAATLPGDGSHVFENTRATFVNSATPAPATLCWRRSCRSWTGACSSPGPSRTEATRWQRPSTKALRPTACSSTQAHRPARCGRSATATAC
jgi:FAD dependent oxidoreductase